MSTVPPGVICSPQDYERSLSNPSAINCLTRGNSIGLTLTAEAGILSLLAICYVLLIIARNVFWRVQHMPTARLRIFHQPMDILMFSIFIADILQGIGMVMSLKWVHEGKVEVGTYCTAQGVIKMVGATAVALSTLGISLYTFISIWRSKGVSSMKKTTIAALSIWVFVGVLASVALGTHRRPSKTAFIGPTPFWCWVNIHYMSWRVVGEYLWMWITLFLSLIIYVTLYFWMRGNIAFNEAKWWKLKVSTSLDTYPHSLARRRRSLVMLVYPVVYSLGILPLSVTRWIAFVQEAKTGSSHTPAAATLMSEAVFGLSGFFNVILLLTTKPESGLFGQLMFISPARPTFVIPDNFREQRSVDTYHLGKLPSDAHDQI